MRVLQSQFEIGSGYIRHRPTGAVFRFRGHDPIFETVSWGAPEAEARVKGFLKRDVWAEAQKILQRITLREAA